MHYLSTYFVNSTGEMKFIFLYTTNSSFQCINLNCDKNQGSFDFPLYYSSDLKASLLHCYITSLSLILRVSACACVKCFVSSKIFTRCLIFLKLSSSVLWFICKFSLTEEWANSHRNLKICTKVKSMQNHVHLPIYLCRHH